MISETRSQQIEAAARLIKASSYTVAFTGAGIGTESGIPDFRSAESGLWDQVDPMKVASIYGFKANPKAFYDWVRPLVQVTLRAKPNPAHLALAELEKIGDLRAIITQNIDNLHQRAGSKVVYELHGHMRNATCIHCYRETDSKTLLRDFSESGRMPRCEHCNGILKPNVILFGEQLPIRPFLAAQEAARRAEVMIVVGSSLVVEPACELPLLAFRTGAKLIIVNLEETSTDRYADVIIRGRAATILPELIQQMESAT